jgi:type I restriction enzyme S subunit
MKISEPWHVVPIKDVCEAIIDCVNKTAPIVEYETPYKMIRTSNIKDGWINLDAVKFVEADIFAKWNRRTTPRRGDVILTREAPLGEVGMIRTNDHVFLGQRLVLYRANPDKLDNRFLLAAFQSDYLQAQIKSLGSGATVEHMRVPDAEKLTVKLPSLPVQRRIGDILSAYDDLIENNTRRITILEQMAQMLYREWFVNFRFPGHEKVKMVKSDMGMIPEGWKTDSFTEIADVLSGGTPKTTQPEFWDGKIPFFGPVDAPSGFYATKTKKSITQLGLSRCNSELYPAETTFITARGTVGKVALPSVPMAMNQSCYALQVKPGIRPLYLYILTKECAEQLQQKATGAVFDAITVDTFDRLRIIRPSDRLIEDFDRLVRPLFSLMLNLSKKTENLRNTRDLLLPKLVSGEVSVEQRETKAVAQTV